MFRGSLLLSIALAAALNACSFGSLSGVSGAAGSLFLRCKGPISAKWDGCAGTQTSHDESYLGQWRQGEREGWGFATYAGGHFYVGEWKAGLPEGEGSYVWQDGTTYMGGWAQGQYHGDGSMVFSDGRQYLGEYHQGKRQGQGAYIWADGSKFEGGWQQGQYHGVGVYTNAAGESQEATYNMGEQLPAGSPAPQDSVQSAEEPAASEEAAEDVDRQAE